MEFLGFTINSKSMTIFLLEEKKEKILPLCKTLLNGINLVLRMLTLTYHAVLPSPLHYRSLQMQQIKNLQEEQSYETQTKHFPSEQGKANLNPCIIFDNTIRYYKIGVSGAHCQDHVTGGQWSKDGKELHINN